MIRIMKKQSLARKLSILLVGSSMFCLALLASPESQALECNGLVFSDDLALIIVNNEFAGYKHKISKRKNLYIHEFTSISGTNCKATLKANITVTRKIRQDAHGTMTLEGTLVKQNGRICLVNTKVTSFNLSHTLNIGEWFYQKFTGSTDLCLPWFA